MRIFTILLLTCIGVISQELPPIQSFSSDFYKGGNQNWSITQDDNQNIYFANSLEYWFAGGNNIDYPEIRIFELYEPKPWRDTDIGIAPDMDYAKKYCSIVTPYYIK